MSKTMDVQLHTKIAGILNAIVAGLAIVSGMIATGIWLFVRRATETNPNFSAGEIYSLLMLGISGILTGAFLLYWSVSLAKMRPWAMGFLGYLFSFLYLAAFPLGTALGIYTMIVLAKSRSSLWG